MWTKGRNYKNREDKKGSAENKEVQDLDDPRTKVWDRKTNRNLAISPIHHPLENEEEDHKIQGFREA